MRALDGMEAGVHLPQVEFAGEGLSLRRLADTVDAARANGFAAVSVNDHFLFGAPWLDGLTALAAMAERSGPMTLATTVSLAALRGPVPLAKAVATLDVLSGGRVVAGVGSLRQSEGAERGSSLVHKLPARRSRRRHARYRETCTPRGARGGRRWWSRSVPPVRWARRGSPSAPAPRRPCACGNRRSSARRGDAR